MESKKRDVLENLNKMLKENETIRMESRKKYLRKIKIVNCLVCGFVILIAFLTFLPIYNNLKYEYHADNVLHRIEYLYKGDFEIISPELDDINMRVTPSGLYEMKDKNGIEFKAIQNKTQVTTDYDQHIYKALVLKYLENNKDTNIFYEDLKQDGNPDLYLFKFGINIDSYSNIEKEMNVLYDLKEYIDKNITKYFDKALVSYSAYVRIDNNEFMILSLQEDKTKEYFIESFKIDYTNYLKENNSGDIIIDEQYYKPESLDVYINGDIVNYYSGGHYFILTARYDISRKDYYINLGRIESNLKGICEIERGVNNKLLTLSYNGKTYKFVSSNEVDNQITKDKVPYEWTISMIEDFFDASVTYDLDNKAVFIEF